MTPTNDVLRFKEFQKQGRALQAYEELQEILKRNKQQKPKFNLLKSIPSGFISWAIYSVSSYFILAIGWGIDTRLISLALILGFVASILNEIYRFKWKYIKERYYEFLPKKELFILVMARSIQIPADVNRKDLEDIFRILCYEEEK